MRRLILLASALLLVVAACGGGTEDAETADQGDQAQTTQPDATQAETTQPDVPEVPDVGEVDKSEGSGPSTATVTIGDQTFDFSTEGALIAQCLTDLYGIFSIQLPMIDDNGAQTDGGINIVILHEGTDPDVVGKVNSVKVDVGEESWFADPEHVWILAASTVEAPGLSQVDSVEIDQRTVRGTATFSRDAGGELETVTGTFEATCGEKRLS